MKLLIIFALLLAACSVCPAEKVLFAGFDASGTALEAGSNPYAKAWSELLDKMHGGEHVFASIINEKGLANGAPVIDVATRSFNLLFDHRSAYDQAVKQKLALQKDKLNAILRAAPPSHGTEIIGFLFQAAKILEAYPSSRRQIVIYTDGIQEGFDVNLARMRLTDAEFSKTIKAEQLASRMPSLKGISVWFVTGPSMRNQINTNMLLRMEEFWKKFMQAAGGDLRSFAPILANYDE